MKSSIILMCHLAVAALLPTLAFSQAKLPSTVLDADATSQPVAVTGYPGISNGYKFTSFTAEFGYRQFRGISNTQVVSSYRFNGDYSHSVAYLTDLRSQMSAKTTRGNQDYIYFYAVNSSNVAVGALNGSNDEVDGGTAIISKNGAYTKLPIGKFSAAFGINDKGVVVGSFIDAVGQHGFILENGTYTTLDVPFMSNVIAYGINNLGTVTVQATDFVGEVRSFLYKDGKFVGMDVPGAGDTYIHGINDLGEIVFGYRYVGESVTRGKLYSRGQFIDIVYPYPGTTYTEPFGINNDGVISGNWSFPFVAKPIR